jgi:CBS domain containing-hemolysin-like protein
VTKIGENYFDKIAGDADTLAGLLLEIKGEFPVLNEKVVYNNFEFEVLAMNNRRILKIKFTIST